MPDLNDGETTEVKGSAAKPYILKNIGGVYSCTCMAWRNQSTGVVRTCRHIRKLRGDAAEDARLASAGIEPGEKKPAKAEKAPPPAQLADVWIDQDPAGMMMSEKLDGVRAWWDGKRFVSRLGNTYFAPDWFVKTMPNTVLDGELWMERKAFQKTVSIVRRQDAGNEWRKIRYFVFDAPTVRQPFCVRYEMLAELTNKVMYASVLEHVVCKGLAQMKKALAIVEKKGGEGLMLRDPESLPSAGRSQALLKVKSFLDDEAVIIGHEAGRGRHKGRMGAIRVETPAGVKFSIGTGFDDKDRDNPPAIGSTVTYKYQELTDGGMPRFPVFIGVREEG